MQIPKSELDLTYHGLSTLELVNKLYATGRDIVAREEELKPRYYALGQMLTAARQDPDFLATAGFKTFGDFEGHLLQETGLLRSVKSLWPWKKIAEQLPGLTHNQVQTIAASSLYLIANSAQDRAREPMLEMATMMTYDQLKAAAAEAGYLGAAPVDEGGANLILTGSKEQIQFIQKFLGCPEIQAHVGTREAAEILIAALGETGSSGWPIPS